MLKRLEIVGFKSFPKKTVLDFSNAITAIVGPNGSGKCVTGDTLVQLASGERRPIKELFDEAHKTARKVERYDDGLAVLDSDAHTESLVLNLSSQKFTSRKIAAFVRRTGPEKMLEIETRSGRRITATPYHPLFVLNDGRIEAARADALVPGIRIAAPRRLPVTGDIQSISMFSVLAAFKKEDAVYVPYSRTLAASLEKKVGTRSAALVAHSVGLAPKTVQRFWDEQALPISAALTLFAGEDEAEIFPKRELKSRTWGFIRIPETVDEPLARFLGYIIAEGRNCRNGQIRFVNDDMPLVEDFAACAMKSFGVSTAVRSYKGRGVMDAFISSQTLSRLLDRVFGIQQDGHSRTKRVPPQICASSNLIVSAFLSALFEGDGHFHASRLNSRVTYVEYATASEGLAQDVANLLLRFGISPVIRKKIKRATNGGGEPKPYWSVFIYGTRQLALLAQVLTLRGRKQTALCVFARATPVENPNTDLIPGAAALVRRAAKVAGLKIKHFRKECPTLAAYCELRCEASRPGILRCIEAIERHGIQNVQSKAIVEQLRTLITADVLWDEIVSVNEVPGPEFVYDLCVPGDHNFIGNGIVVHNSNVAEAFRFALGEQSMKNMRGKRAEDLIWGGSHSLPRAQRAAVSVVFDNTRRAFKIDFDEVTIERAVFRDGTSEYSINGSKVRLRDVEELLSEANIGRTAHHIISQGESDRILLASPKDRRAMLEDALGLKIYEFKKQEAERKLEKTEGNIAQVNSLRRELAPHLRFLEKQVEKFERSQALQEELKHIAQKYFAIEDVYLAHEIKKVENEQKNANELLSVVSLELAKIEERASNDEEGRIQLARVREIERNIERIISERSLLSRDIGRVEGALTAVKERNSQVARDPYTKIPREELLALANEVERQSAATSVDELLSAIKYIHNTVKAFVKRFAAPADDLLMDEERAVYKLEEERQVLMKKDVHLSEELERARSALVRARTALTAHDETGKELQRRIVDLARKKAHEESEILRTGARIHELALLLETLEQEKREVLALVGTGALSYTPLDNVDNAHQDERRVQDERKRILERTKIRLEEAGGMGIEILQEHKEASEREKFLTTELDDLVKSSASLRELIKDLDSELAKHFSAGLEQVNASFTDYFSLMFGGGSARLELEEIDGTDTADEGNIESSESENVNATDGTVKKIKLGIEIAVNLQKKKVRSLMQLSGGERALTSIALIFAMSQVNPPPFLILDETDAALDEANSRRYGDMIENLVKRSQLIVVTHNRETMSRAGILYGVTMGGDGVSKLLSVKFEEALSVAK